VIARIVLALALVVLAAGCGGGDGEGAATTAAPATTAAAAPPEGELVFRQNCTGCHTLGAAGATGKVGPNLDEAHPTTERVEFMVRNGGTGGLGSMPKFEGSLSDAQIGAVARFVAESAGQ